MTAEELRAFEGDTMTSTAPKRCDLPDVALTGAKPGITAFVLGNAERAELTAVAQKCGELDPSKNTRERARFDEAWRMELKLFGIGSRQFLRRHRWSHISPLRHHQSPRCKAPLRFQRRS